MTEYFFATSKDTYVLRTPGPEVARGLAHRTQYSLLKGIVNSGRKLEVCSLNCLVKQDPKIDSDHTEAMSRVSEPAEHGGWRSAEVDMVCLEVANFRPGHAMIGLEDLTQKLFMSHPAVKGGLLFPFSRGLPLQLFTVLTVVSDIRRFVDLDKPQRRFKLRNYFNVATPTVFFKIVASQHLKPEQLPTQAVLDAWYEARPSGEYPKFTGKPRDYFHNKYFNTVLEMEKKQHNGQKAVAMGLWKTTVRFVDFLQLTWESGLGLTKFDPVEFFDNEKEAEEFYEFIKLIDNSVDISQLMDKQ